MTQLERMKAAVEKVRDMRLAQRQYFKTRDRDDLAHSKKLEKETDVLIAEALREDDIFETAAKLTIKPDASRFCVACTVEQLTAINVPAGFLPDITVVDALPSTVGAIVIGGGRQVAKVKFYDGHWRIVEFRDA